MADLEVSAVLADRGLDVTFTVAQGEVLAVVGPNGAGKSTLASVIAGVLHGDRVVVRVGGRTLTDTAGGVNVAVHDRKVGLLAQDPLLFPHMTALANVLFGASLAAKGSNCGLRAGLAGRRRGAGSQARHWLRRVGVAELAGRKPSELSGGQAQRVALARALAADPAVLLLDEPLAGLDVGAAASVRAELRTVLTEYRRTALLITHDLLDVLGLADRVLVLEAGRIAEIGAVADVLAAPRSRFGARLAGVNAVRGVMAGPAVLQDRGGQLWHGITAGALGPDADAVAIFSPASVAVYRDQPHGSPRNSVHVRVVGLEVVGGTVRVRAAVPDDDGVGLSADISPEAVADMGLTVGDHVWFTVKTQEVGLHAAYQASRSAG